MKKELEDQEIFEIMDNRKRLYDLTAQEQMEEAKKIKDMYRFLVLYLKTNGINFAAQEPQKILKPIEANLIQWPENIFLKILRFPYRALRAIIEKTGLKDKIVHSRLYNKMAESGLFFALGR